MLATRDTLSRSIVPILLLPTAARAFLRIILRINYKLVALR